MMQLQAFVSPKHFTISSQCSPALSQHLHRRLLSLAPLARPLCPPRFRAVVRVRSIGAFPFDFKGGKGSLLLGYHVVHDIPLKIPDMSGLQHIPKVDKVDTP